MNDDEFKWVESAIKLCVQAKEKGVNLLLLRTQAGNDEADVAVTNAATPEMVRALFPVINQGE
jgi:hypothetical protein